MDIFLQLMASGLLVGGVYALIALGFVKRQLGICQFIQFAHKSILGNYVSIVRKEPFSLPA